MSKWELNWKWMSEALSSANVYDFSFLSLAFYVFHAKWLCFSGVEFSFSLCCSCCLISCQIALIAYSLHAFWHAVGGVFICIRVDVYSCMLYEYIDCVRYIPFRDAWATSGWTIANSRRIFSFWITRRTAARGNCFGNIAIYCGITR